MPRHKKKKRAANAAAGSVKRTDWFVGDLVVVKLRGHRPWPAQIQKPEDYGYDAQPHRIFVTFFGTEETCFCSYNKITPFTSAMRKTFAEQLQKINTNPELERAIKEIFAADDEFKKSHDSSRHKEDEIGSEKSEGAEPPVERTRKRGRAVEDEGTADIAEGRHAKQEKTVKKMAAEQVHKLPRKVRIKVSTQQSDSPNNQQADSGAIPGSEKASVSSSEAPSREVSPHRTSDSNERVGVADAPGQKDARATSSVHDTVELADTPDKKNVRASSGQKCERSVLSNLKDDAATVAMKGVAKHGVENADDADNQVDMEEVSLKKEPLASANREDVEKMDVDDQKVDMEEDSLRKEPLASANREDVEKMDVDDQKVEDVNVVRERRGNGKESDNVDHGAEGLNKEVPEIERSYATEQHQSDPSDTPLSATVNPCGQTTVTVKEGDSKSNKSMDSGDRDVSGGRSGVKGDLEDHQTSHESLTKDENEGSVVTTKTLQAATTPQGEAAEVEQDGGTNVAGSSSTKQEDDSKEPQAFEPPVLEKPVTVAASTATSAKDLPSSNRETYSKDSASGQTSDSSSRPGGALPSGEDSVKVPATQNEVMQNGQDLAPAIKDEAMLEVSIEDQNPSSTTQGVIEQPIVKDQVPTMAKQDQDVPGDTVISDQQASSGTTSLLPAILPRETIVNQIPGQSEERLGSDHQTATFENQGGARESLVTSHASGDDATKTQVLDGDTDMTEARDDDSVKSKSTDLSQAGGDDAVETHSTNRAEGGDDLVKTESTVMAEGGSGDAVKTVSTDMTQVPGGDGLKTQQQASMPKALVDHEVTTQSADGPQGVGGNVVSTQSTNRTQAVSEDSAKTQSTDEDPGKTQSTGKDSATTHTTGKDLMVTELMGEAFVVEGAVGEYEKVTPSRADDQTLKPGVDVSDRDVSVKEATTEGVEEVAVSSRKLATTDGEQVSLESLKETPAQKDEVPTSPVKGLADEEEVSVSPVKETDTNKEEVLVAPVKGAGTDVDKVTVPPAKDARVDDEKAPVSTVQEASIASKLP